jgi:hypothetical protein
MGKKMRKVIILFLLIVVEIYVFKTTEKNFIGKKKINLNCILLINIF